MEGMMPEGTVVENTLKKSWVRKTFESSTLYFAAGIGGFLMGVMDLLTKQEPNSEALIYRIGEKLVPLFESEYKSVHLAFIFLALLGVFFAWMKKPKDRYESFIVGFAAFALVSALLPQTQKKTEPSNVDETIPVEDSLDSFSSAVGSFGGLQESDSGGYSFEIIQTAQASAIQKKQRRVTVYPYLLYIKGGTHKKVVSSNIRILENNRIVGERQYSGNRAVLMLGLGSYKLKIFAKTYSGLEFQASATIQTQKKASGGIIYLDKADIEPIGTYSKLTRYYSDVDIERFNDFEVNKQLGIFNSVKKNYAQAVSYYKKAISDGQGAGVSPSELNNVSVLKGYAHYRNNELKLSEQSLVSAYETHPENKYAWVNLVKVLCASNNKNQARKVFGEKMLTNQDIVRKDRELIRECGQLNLQNWKNGQ